MKTLIAALLFGLCLSTALAIEDGFLCRPYKNGQPAPCSLYCAYLNNGSMQWELDTCIYSNGSPKRFCKDIEYADAPIQYYQYYKFCAWDGTHRSEWTEQVEYVPDLREVYDLSMTIYCPMAPDPTEED